MDILRIKKVTSMEKVFPLIEPSGEGMEDVLTGLRGETVSFQIAYFWEGIRKSRAAVRVVSEIHEYVRVRSVKLVPCEYPAHEKYDEDYVTNKPGLYPDLLKDIPFWGVDLVPGHWSSLWVDLECSEELTPGVYPVRIDIIKDGKVLGVSVMALEVLKGKLPDLQIPHTEWFHSDCLSDYYHVEVFSEDYWRIVENFVQLAVKRKCNMLLTPIFTPPLDTAVGGERRTVQLVDVKVTDTGYVFGYKKFERWVEMCHRCGIKYFEISHLFSQWGATMAPKILGEEDGKIKKIFGWETDALGLEYREFIHQFLASFTRELKELGIEERTYFHVSDEPNLDQFESYKAAKKMVERDLEGYQIIDALSDYNFYEKGVVSQPVCAVNHIQPFLEKRPEKLWGYYCTAQYLDVTNRFIVQQGYRTRILGAQMYKYQLDGFLHWGYNFYNSENSICPINPYQCTDAAGAFPSGDPFLVYPGEGGVPEESIRMMLMDEAMSDLCAMNYLESLTDRRVVMECLEAGEEKKIEFESYPRSCAYITRMRKRIHQAIKDYTK